MIDHNTRHTARKLIFWHWLDRVQMPSEEYFHWESRATGTLWDWVHTESTRLTCTFDADPNSNQFFRRVLLRKSLRPETFV